MNENNTTTTPATPPTEAPQTRTKPRGQQGWLGQRLPRAHLALQTKENSKAKEDREVMLLVSDVVRRDITRTSIRTMEVKAVETKFETTNKILRTIKGKIKETLKEITKHKPALKEDAEHLAEYTAYVQRLL
ncbi:hypothetical protein Tco_0114169 [Tanacetum coccineum]